MYLIYSLQTVTVLYFPFNFDFIYFYFSYLIAVARTSNTILNKIVKFGILVLSLTLEEALSAFHH